MNPTHKLVILDRDGTINADSDDYIKSPEEWQPLPGSLEAIARLNHAGWHVVVATNQSGLGRGLYDAAAFNAIHAKMNAALARVGGRVDAVFFCPHAPADGCGCRKPAPGLFEQIARRYGIELAGVPAVGDSLRDLQAAAAAGCEPHLVLTGKSQGLDDAAGEALLARVPGSTAHADLTQFAEFVVQRERRARAAARGEADEPDSDAGGLVTRV
ncbi:MAG TPA: D-glycero-beta-D-manno-heptose 1,7-bisphosphate 7-phosphatase [Methylibium sp.]|uniref:D-glycero-beta-D-manno-heptose 1,7-bisphosphate 7-phosphatase n=1 Tax=Methylibium sp. TaxID=2067992 RepID=UPI002DBF888F|nr:D-glycero-beta-D-manno-heptose 1,7-bisphosphate 7-phosphatase [Methylibium sp.]HEU4460907.1 D-glycero-beta-D-manno-heptose 1,7-bisphosphate 7-phosphatase [Methylibium sp.]